MKKQILILCLAFSLLLSGCQFNDKHETDKDTLIDTSVHSVKEKVQKRVKEKIGQVTDTIEKKADIFIDSKTGKQTSKIDNKITVEVKQAVDGDTLKIKYSSEIEELYCRYYSCKSNNKNMDKLSIRVLNVDTPEVHGSKAIQYYGPEASSYAKKVLEGKKVEIELSEKKNPFDKYGRLLAYVFVDGQLYEEMVVKKGLARIAYVYEPDKKYLGRLEAAQQYAKKHKLGIWSITGYVQKTGYDMQVVK